MDRFLMKKTSTKFIHGGFLSLLIIFTITGCKMSGDVLAEYTGGKITRGQMYEWLKVRGITKEAAIKKKAIQKNKVKQMVLDALTVQDAVKHGFDKTEEFQNKLIDVKRSFYAGYTQKQLTEKGKFSEEAVSVRLIRFVVQNYKMEDNKRKEITGKDLEDAVNIKKEAAIKVLKEYESGAKFDELAKKYSEDYTGKTGGLTGYITRDMREPEFSEAVFKMKKGEYTKEPLKIGNAFYIVFVEDKTALTDENIESNIKDKTNSATMKRRLSAKGITSRVEKLKQEKDVEITYDAIGKGNPSAVIFKIGDKSYTVKELDAYIVKIYDKAHHPNRKPIDSKAKKDIAERLLTEELLARELIRTGLDKNESFVQEWSHYYAHILSTEFKNSKVIGEVTVTDQEIKEEYDKNKNRSYVKREMKGKDAVQSFYPFYDVKDKIKQMLINKKKMQLRRQWEEKILSDNNFKIYEDKLEGK